MLHLKIYPFGYREANSGASRPIRSIKKTILSHGIKQESLKAVWGDCGLLVFAMP